MNREAPGLVNAARRLFGSFKSALHAATMVADDPLLKTAFPAAGIGMKQDDKTGERLLELLRERRLAGLSLNCMLPELQTWRHCARRNFGSWRQARVLAGDTTNTYARPRRVYSSTRKPEKLLDILWERRLAGLSLNCRQPELWRWYNCAMRHFGSWRRARALAGDPDFISANIQTREQFLDMLRERARAGLPIESKNPEMRPYFGVAKRLFGSWTKAREAAGFPRHVAANDRASIVIEKQQHGGAEHEQAKEPEEGGDA
jgi:hypothetical protein